MSRIKVEITSEPSESANLGAYFPIEKQTIEFGEIHSIGALEAAFVSIALAAGFTYVGAVECVRFKSVALEE
jgi:hypothetical protein